MNKKIGLSVSVALAAAFFVGCSATNNTGLMADARLYKGKQRCAAINQDLVEVNKYIEKVTYTSAFHLDEAAEAIEVPNISVSNNKAHMLKDANALKKSLEVERQQLGCQNLK